MMADTNSFDVILDFLRRNHFTRAEAALWSELSNRPDLNGSMQKLNIEDKDSGKVLEGENGGKLNSENQGLASQNSDEVSKELIVKEIECGTGGNGSESKWRNSAIGDWSKPDETIGKSLTSVTFSKNSDDAVLDLYSWNCNPRNGPSIPHQNDDVSNSKNLSELQISEQPRLRITEGTDFGKVDLMSGEEIVFSGEKRISYIRSTSKANVETKFEKRSDPIEVDRPPMISSAYSKENVVDNPWSRGDNTMNSNADLWNDCSVKTVFPFSKGDASTSYGTTSSEKREGKKKADGIDARAAIKEQMDEVGRALYFGKSLGSSDQNHASSLGFPLGSDNAKEEFPRLPPVKLKSEDKPLNGNWEEKRDVHGAKLTSADSSFLIGSYLDVPIGQEISSSGMKRAVGGSWLSVSQGITEDTSDLVSGFATVGDGLSESVEYPNEYWDSDEYDDDDDVGYMRQPIEDEAWFLAHEIDYPSDNEKGMGHGSVPDPQERGPTKDDDDQSFAEEDSYFSGEQYFLTKNMEPVSASDDPRGLSVTEMHGRSNETDLMAQYDGQLMDEEELNLMRAEPVWQGFVTQTNELIMLGDGEVLNESGRARLDDVHFEEDQHGSVRSIGVGIKSDAAEFGSEVRESLVGGSSEGDVEYFCDHDVGPGTSRHSHHDSNKKYVDKSNRDEQRISKHGSHKYVVENEKSVSTQVKNRLDGGFSFPPPLKDGGALQAVSSKSLRSKNCNALINNETDSGLNALMGKDGSDSSTVKTFTDDYNLNAVRSENSSPSSHLNYGYTEHEYGKKEEDEKTDLAREEDLVATFGDEEAAAVQEQVKQIKAQEDEFETFNLKIVHRKNRHGSLFL